MYAFSYHFNDNQIVLKSTDNDPSLFMLNSEPIDQTQTWKDAIKSHVSGSKGFKQRIMAINAAPKFWR